jgi:two-component system response regulator YesN
MEHTIINVLLVDDEVFVREGLKQLIDWNALGCCICGEAANGEEALGKIRTYQPGLVLLDIRMPKMYGTDLIAQARAEGFDGDFIILSGFSDFKYAQVALHYGVSFYLTKPIDENALTESVLAVRKRIEERENQKYSMNQYLRKAKLTVLHDLLIGKEFNNFINYMELGLTAPIYQVVMYNGYTPFFQAYNFADLLRVTNQDNNSFEPLTIDNTNTILLKGNFALERFNSCLAHYAAGTEKGSPLDSIFLTYGPCVSTLSQIHESYEVCRKLMKRRFFCEANQHVLSREMLPDLSTDVLTLSPASASYYVEKLMNDIQTFNRRMVNDDLENLREELFHCRNSIMDIKHFLVDIFLQVKQMTLHRYSEIDIPFTHNSAIIELIENKYYLYEILFYFSEQFGIIIRAIGNNSSESIFDDILYYINHNYQMSLKLETIASLFGYNSSYLGKLFTQKSGMNFNAYLDNVRIKEASKLLLDTNLKVYEISTQVGYKNVDYFHQKFKKQMGMSPAEYRKK